MKTSIVTDSMLLHNIVGEMLWNDPEATEHTILAILRLDYGMDPHPMDLHNAMEGNA